MIFSVLFYSFLLMLIITTGVMLATRDPKMKWRDEFRIGIVGAVWFTYVSWACIYMAQYRPFPYIKSEKHL